MESRLLNRGCKRVARKVGKASRAGPSSNVDHQLDAVSFQQIQKDFDLSGRMADRVNGPRKLAAHWNLETHTSTMAMSRVGKSLRTEISDGSNSFETSDLIKAFVEAGYPLDAPFLGDQDKKAVMKR